VGVIDFADLEASKPVAKKRPRRLFVSSPSLSLLHRRPALQDASFALLCSIRVHIPSPPQYVKKKKQTRRSRHARHHAASNVITPLNNAPFVADFCKRNELSAKKISTQSNYPLENIPYIVFICLY